MSLFRIELKFDLIYCFIVLENICKQTDTHTQSSTDAAEMIPYQNSVDGNQTVIIASVAVSVT